MTAERRTLICAALAGAIAGALIALARALHLI